MQRDSSASLAKKSGESMSGVSNPAVVDLFGIDEQTGEVLLVMNEPRPWDGGDEQLHELQEKFNAYASFVLDGEMTEAHPQLADKPVRIELHCWQVPGERPLRLLQAIHDQLELQEIKMEVIVAEKSDCGEGCCCHGSPDVR